MAKPTAANGTGPYHTTVLSHATPKRIGSWKRVEAYGKLPHGHGPLDLPTAAAHYRSDDHVIVVRLIDWGTDAAAIAVLPELAGTHEIDTGTMTNVQRGGRWVQENSYRKPYDGKVVGGFNYNMRLDPEAMPRHDGLAFMMYVVLANGIQVSVSGPEDTSLAMLQQVFAGLDLDRIEKLPRPPKEAE